MNHDVQQRDRALVRANETRHVRARLKQQVKRGELSVAAVVLDPPAEAEGMTVYDLVIEQRTVGRQFALKLLRRARVSESALLGGLSDLERRMLAEELTELLAARRRRRRSTDADGSMRVRAESRPGRMEKVQSGAGMVAAGQAPGQGTQRTPLPWNYPACLEEPSG